MRTLAFPSTAVDTCTRNEYIVYYREHTFATHPSAIPVLDLAIVEHCSFV